MTNQTVGRPAFATPESVALVAHVRDCEVCRPAFSVEAMCDHGVNLMIAAKINDHMRRLRGNDLVQLEECMIADPSIPSGVPTIAESVAEALASGSYLAPVNRPARPRV